MEGSMQNEQGNTAESMETMQNEQGNTAESMETGPNLHMRHHYPNIHSDYFNQSGIFILMVYLRGGFGFTFTFSRFITGHAVEENFLTHLINSKRQ